MESVFRILAVIFIGIAAFFLWKGNGDGAFISAVIGAVSFFLSIRFQVKGRLKQREEQKARRGDGENSDSDLLSDDLAAGDQTDDEPKANL